MTYCVKNNFEEEKAPTDIVKETLLRTSMML